MKKFLVLLTVASYIFAAQEAPNEYKDGLKGRDLLVGRAGYFFFTDGTNREVWDNGTIDVELENNYWYTNRYSTFQNINFIWRDGTSSFNTPVSINMATISLGIKQFFPIIKDYFNAYLGFGFTCGLVWTNNESNFIPNHNFWASPGIVGKSGLVFFTERAIMFDLFFDVYYQPIWTSALDSYTDMGGFKTGLGIGYLF